MTPCTNASHREVAADPDRFRAELVNVRSWSEAGLLIAECPRCFSSLCREIEEADRGT